jgi:hypothetical protein
MRGEQFLDHQRQLADLGGDGVDPVEDGLEQPGVIGGEELRALQRRAQLGDLAAGLSGAKI